MALGSTQPLVKMSTRDVPEGKGGRCVRLTTCHHIVPMSRNLGAVTLLDPSGHAWPVMGVLYLYLLQWLCELASMFLTTHIAVLSLHYLSRAHARSNQTAIH
jgi:hypothetical protein